MKNFRSGKCFLALMAVCSLAPSALAVTRGAGSVNSVQVPEGGSAAVYLLAAGLTCLGAMVFSSKLAKASK